MVTGWRKSSLKNQHWERRLSSWKWRKPEHWQKKQFPQHNAQTVLCPAVIFTPALALVSSGVVLLSLMHALVQYLLCPETLPNNSTDGINSSPYNIFFKIFFFRCGPVLKSLLTLLQYCFCLMLCFFDHETWDLRNEPVPPALRRQSLNH